VTGVDVAPRSNALLVAIDRARIVVTLRGHGDREVTRSIDAPADRAARLRMIAWLAGNLARDQLATLKLPEAKTEAPPPDPPAAAPSAAVEAAAAEEAPPAPPPEPTEPPPVDQPAAASGPPAPRAPEPVPSVTPAALPDWTFSVMGGLAVTGRAPWQSNELPSNREGVWWSGAAVLEAHRHFGATFLGVAADYGPRPFHQIGGALVVGKQWKMAPVQLEASGGAGVELFIERDFYPFLEWTQYSDETHVRAYGRGAFAATYPLAPQIDAVAQLVGHGTVTDLRNALSGLLALGVRLTLP
jgi:hypothetical protein